MRVESGGVLKLPFKLCNFLLRIVAMSLRFVYSAPKMRILAKVCEVLVLTEFIIFLGCTGAEKNVDRALKI